MADSLSARLLECTSEVWNRALGMRFVAEVSDDSISDDAFARYMWWEGRFVHAAIRTLGAAILRAPNQTAVLGHARTLATLIDDQLDQFEYPAAMPPGPASAALAEPLIREAVAGAERLSYPELVVAMLPSELLYEEWCRRAVQRLSTRPAIANWVHLHTEPPFTTQVQFLRDEVDALEVPEAEFPTLADLVARRLELEIDFHAASFVGD